MLEETRTTKTVEDIAKLPCSNKVILFIKASSPNNYQIKNILGWKQKLIDIHRRWQSRRESPHLRKTVHPTQSFIKDDQTRKMELAMSCWSQSFDRQLCNGVIKLRMQFTITLQEIQQRKKSKEATQTTRCIADKMLLTIKCKIWKKMSQINASIEKLSKVSVQSMYLNHQ